MVILALAFSAAIHGNVVAVDRPHNLLTVHHHAHAGMGMEMTMAVRLRDPRRLSAFKKGDFVNLRCDESRNPWVCEEPPPDGTRRR